MRKLKFFVAGAAIAALLALSLALAASDEKAKLQKVFETGFAALNADDIAAFAAIHVQDETMVNVGPVEGELHKGWTSAKQGFQAFMASPAKLTKPVSVAMKVLGDAAWGVWTFTTEMEMEGKTMATLNRLTLVFERVDDKWLVSHSHASAGLPPAAPPMTEK